MKKYRKYFLMVAVAAWWAFLLFNANMRDVIVQRKELKRLKSEFITEQMENARLKTQLSRVTQQFYIEALIRKNLNKSYKDEIVFNLE